MKNQKKEVRSSNKNLTVKNENAFVTQKEFLAAWEELKKERKDLYQNLANR